MLANTKSKYEHKKIIFGYLSKLKRSSVLLGTVPSNPKVTGDRSPVSPVVVTRLVHTSFERWCLLARSSIADQDVILVYDIYYTNGTRDLSK